MSLGTCWIGLFMGHWVRRLLGACLPNQSFNMLVSTLLHIFHFPNCIFSFQISKLSVLFNVVELKMLFHYLDNSFSVLTCFCPFAYQRMYLAILSFYISATISAPLKRFLSLSVLQWLWKSYIRWSKLPSFSFKKQLWLLSLMCSFQAGKQCVLLKKENKQLQRCFSLPLHLQYILQTSYCNCF